MKKIITLLFFLAGCGLSQASETTCWKANSMNSSKSEQDCAAIQLARSVCRWERCPIYAPLGIYARPKKCWICD